ncbi:MAG: Co2+/Mg2+ efflux protein ApaG [Cellvibrionales bacterium]|nr:Co2+/Mg2+ efflux protein ApaG [Cellvibrionales bacterium]
MRPPSIEITSHPRFEPQQSQTHRDRYFYSYRICIINRGAEPCQLISRRWLITDGNGQKQEVAGAGVVGQQPILEQGAEFSYTSGLLLETPVGTMQGFYLMRTHCGREFKTPIPPFLLAVPGAVN